MTDQDWNQLHAAIEQMTKQEKRALRDRLDRALAETDRPSTPSDQMTPQQLHAMRNFLDAIAKLPPGDDPYHDLGYSNEAHDKILYDLEQS